jgi:hypothetical protein
MSRRIDPNASIPALLIKSPLRNRPSRAPLPPPPPTRGGEVRRRVRVQPFESLHLFAAPKHPAMAAMTRVRTSASREERAITGPE